MGIHGVIPFSRFMELALYCPNLGYYERAEVSPGRAGDFFTSVSVGPVFGRLLAARFADWLEAIPGGKVQLVEAGAHDGQLALDILSWFEDNRSRGGSCLEGARLEYWLIEPSARHREWQARRLARFADRLRWFDSPADLGAGAVRGVIFSNELFDAFPVTRLCWRAAAGVGTWRELGVKAGPAGFEWADLPLNPERVRELLDDAGLQLPPELVRILPDGFTIDLADGAGRWWRSAAVALGEGVLMTMDYGLMAEQFLSPARAAGTLRAYQRHHLVTDVLADPGGQDLTSHVNFSQLIRAGESAGLSSEAVQSQARFLVEIARDQWERKGVTELAADEVRQLLALTHPEHLGRRFQVLIQRRRRPDVPGGAT